VEDLARQDFLIGDDGDRAVDADFGHLSFGQVKVRAFGGDQVAEECVDLGHVEK